jgi:RND superfamily putative drug exporter
MPHNDHATAPGAHDVPRPGFIPDLARWCVRRHWVVIGAWGVAVALLVVLARTTGGDYVDDFVMPGAPSQQASDLLHARFPSQAGDSATLVVHAPGGLSGPAIRERVTTVMTQAASLPDVTGIITPQQAPGRVSADATIAYATILYAQRAPNVPPASVDALEKLAADASGDGLVVEVGGPVVSASEKGGEDWAEAVGLVAAVVILLFAFGSFIAMGLPLLTAIVGLGCGLLGLCLVAAATSLATITPSFVAMIGLGVGIDYALFIVTRHREGLAAGLSVEEAAASSLDSSGRAVITAGGVVVISLLGLYAIGVPFIGNLGAAAALVVILSIAVAMTLLPALLGLCGRSLDRWRIARFYGEGGTPSETSGFGYTLSRQIQRRPWVCAVTALVILVVLAAPIRSLQLGFADDGFKPESRASRRAYDLLVQGFGPGTTGPLVLVVTADSALDQSALQKLEAALSQTAGVAAVSPAQTNADGTTAVLRVIPTTGSSDPKTSDLVHTLRDDVIPAALAGSTTTAYVGGPTATFVDLGDRIEDRMPLFFALVIGLSFLLLTTVFRSVAIPTTAAVMNLLSVGAAYGVLVAVFQKGWGAGLLGIEKTGPIETYLPMILFAILFGLSTDYEVFLLSRIRERYLAHGDNGEAVAQGLAITTRIITAAATIMVCVFLAFVLNPQRPVKEFGFGLAVAVLVDATVVRIILVPSVMELLGDRNWWFPGWLDRVLPRLNVEGEPATDMTAGAE